MAHDTEKLRELLERVEKATGPDREIDGCIATLLDGYFLEKRGKDRKAWYYPINGRCRRDPEGYGPGALDRYTASTDCALAIMDRNLKGWEIDLSIINGQAGVDVRGPAFGDNSMQQWNSSKVLPTPLAILSACLRALISQAEGEAKHGEGIPPDVRKLVIAARNVAFDDAPSPEALKALDDASEAFAARVPWEDAT